MDHRQDSTLLAALAAIPEPRHARGKQLEWTFILGVHCRCGVEPPAQCGGYRAVGTRARRDAYSRVSATTPARAARSDDPPHLTAGGSVAAAWANGGSRLQLGNIGMIRTVARP